ncbi:hypothetical protein [Mucilaginibacter pedocola]|uniref:Uncharacterized protein n=1 Tax=Mucilaginibacter pedocola TaxID=1792845 RepID=A0A1S9PD16_9SPHI|nr:hypothetical protein [Mucilaginibacter pedocola]OOQ58865.1 hypothetical protein BC343_09485 [Mucilaginibacter pedocola]
MKRGLLILSCVFWMAPTEASAQNAAAIESKLNKAFNKIAYWDKKRSYAGADDSLILANDQFAAQLLSITGKYPGTISQPFKSLANSGLRIATCEDGALRIYSWDTGLGGTMRKYKNIVQYRSGAGTKSIALITDPNGYEPFYSGLHNIKAGKTTYYLGLNTAMLSSAYIVQGVKVFAITQAKLDTDAKLIKTESGLNNSLHVESDLSASVNNGISEQPRLSYDSRTRTIKLPLVTAEGRITKNFITYKFTGQYFEKVVNLAK